MALKSHHRTSTPHSTPRFEPDFQLNLRLIPEDFSRCQSHEYRFTFHHRLYTRTHEISRHASCCSHPEKSSATAASYSGVR
ncbi:unnamed protein product [Zymoseptoria tritici ST99CH_3D7]|uniref:Uncharacterized protein n=1 Tax=Zymoseptoria tritici (strain ST99CH_3D7) TaxID=1276538 RepID=A0A1X7RF71_ZYMT9|nr:unnamed protein product [Zymoseptoria tritici ST99CH_3D7]